MDGERLFSAIILAFVGFVCGAIFYGIGFWASKRSDPAPFYSGTTVDAASVSDVKAYNAENAKMWKMYSAPYFLMCLFSIFGCFRDWAGTVAIVLLIGSCTVGILWLLRRYKKICRKYMIR